MTFEPRRTVFADTFYWISLASPGDFAHKAATAFDVSPTRPMVVTIPGLAAGAELAVARNKSPAFSTTVSNENPC